MAGSAVTTVGSDLVSAVLVGVAGTAVAVAGGAGVSDGGSSVGAAVGVPTTTRAVGFATAVEGAVGVEVIVDGRHAASNSAANPTTARRDQVQRAVIPATG